MSISIDGTGTISGISVGGLTDGCVTPSDLSQPLTLETAQSATGTAVDFTGIPSWVKRITVMFYRVSTNGSSLPIVRVGTSGGIVSTGYESIVGYAATAGTTVSSTQHFGIAPSGAWANTLGISGSLVLSKITGDDWIASLAAMTYLSIQVCGGGSVTLSGTLDRIRITTVNGTDTFDAGTINIMYE